MKKETMPIKSYFSAKEIFQFLTSKIFLRQLFYMVMTLLALLFILSMWLRFYTNHGQKLELPNYIDVSFTEAAKDAEDRSFTLIVTDSVHNVGQEGGIIIDQNPPEGAFVKENRKIYVRTTKYKPDVITSGDLPVLYGNNFNQKRRELNQRALNVKIKEYKYDSGAPDHILEVWYKGEILFDKNISRKDVNIEKGGTLEVVLSKKTGGSLAVPDLACQTLAQVRWYLEELQLKLGDIKYGDDVENVEEAYIKMQIPAYDPINKIQMGESIDVVLTGKKPDGC
jgi:beta-lactam-binding protein with PASTA domain